MNSHLTLRSEPGSLLTPNNYNLGPEEEGFELNFHEIWAAIYRNRRIVLVTIGTALIAGVIVTMLSTRIYKSSSSVQIEQQTNNIMGNNAEQQETVIGGQDADRFLQTQVDIIKSQAVATRVAENLGLYNGDQFFIAMGLKPPKADTSASSRRQAINGILMSDLSVDLPRDSRIVSLAFESSNPAMAQKVSNAYAQNYITSNLQRRFDASSYARSFLQQQLGLAKDRLERSERAALAYARQAGLLDTSNAMSGGSNQDGSAQSTGTQSLTTSDLVQVNTAYVAAQAARIDAEQRWRQAQSTPLLSLPEVLASPAVQALTQQRVTLQSAYEQDLQRRKPEFPTMKQNLAQIQTMTDQINQIAEHIRDGIRDQYQTALKQEHSLAASVGQLKGATLAEQDRSVQYNILKRETDTNRSMYDALLQRYKEVSAQAGVTANNISMLDAADLPTTPVRPRPLMNLGIALVLGCSIAALIVFLRERFDDSIRSPEDVTNKLNLPFLSSVPLLPPGTAPFDALMDPRSAFSEAYFSLRASLRLLSSAGTPTSLLLTSSRESEGKSTTAVALARSFAQIGAKVLLIDGDLRKPSLHRTIGMANEVGMSNVLARQQSLASVTQQTEMTDLHFIAAGPLPPSPTLLLSGPALAEILEQSRGLYDLTIIDGPPVLGIADAILYGVAVAASIFVVEAGRNNHGAGRAALRRLLSSGANVIGVVLTKFDAKSAGYGPDYGYYYSYGSDESRPALES